MAFSEVFVEGLGPQGDGLGRGPAGRVFVERAAPGDRVSARIHRDDRGLARAEILRVVEPSPYRQKPPCPHYESCGNCTVQHLQNDFYRRWKTDLVKDALRKQGLRPREWLPSVFVSKEARRRVTFNAFRRGDRVFLGYYRRRSKHITDITTCLVSDPKLLELRSEIHPCLGKILVDGQFADVFFQKAGAFIDVVLTGEIGRTGGPDERIRKILEAFAEKARVQRVSWRASEEDATEVLVSRGPGAVTLGELNVSLPPAAFLQPSGEGERALVSGVLRSLPETGRFADLFSGCGTFAGEILKRGPVDAYESSLLAVKALSHAGKKNQLRVFRRDLFRNPLRRDELNRYDAVVVDPPRAGCLEQVEALAQAKTRTVVSVSCNPATFARDARVLCAGGYWFQSVQVVDQFLWSHHTEVIGVFTKGKRRSFR